MRKLLTNFLDRGVYLRTHVDYLSNNLSNNLSYDLSYSFSYDLSYDLTIDLSPILTTTTGILRGYY